MIFLNNPKLTGFDTVLFMVLALVVFYSINAFSTGTNLSPFQYQPKVIFLLFMRVLLGNLNYDVVFVGLKFAPVSKAVLILCLSPLFSIIIAAIFLKEKMSKLTIFLTIASIFGVYLMTLNKEDQKFDTRYEILGYSLMM